MRTRTGTGTAGMSGTGARVALPCAAWKPTALSRLLATLDELHDDDGIAVRLGTEAQLTAALGRDAAWTGAPGMLLAVATHRPGGPTRLYLAAAALEAAGDARLLRRARLALLAVYEHALRAEDHGRRCVAVAVERGRQGLMLAERRPTRWVVSFDITKKTTEA